MSASMPPTPADSHYRLAPAVVWRVLGAQLVAFGAGFLGVIVLVAFADVPGVLAVVVLLSALLVTTGTAWWLRSRAAVVTLSARGYAVRLLRGAGVRDALWSEVSEVVTTAPSGVALVVLRLESGAETTVPVAALAADREGFVRDLQRRLQSGRGLRPL